MLAIIIVMVIVAFTFYSKKEEDLPSEEIIVIENGEEINEQNDQEEVENLEPHPEEDLEPVIRAKEDLKKVLGINYQEINLVDIQKVVFSDHTLGTSSPGEIENQVPTPGYVVILSAKGKDYRYHLDDNTLFFIE